MIIYGVLGWDKLVPANDAGGDSHIIPTYDVREHIPSRDCWCQPVDDPDCPNFEFMHNSLDRREDYELGRRQLN